MYDYFSIFKTLENEGYINIEIDQIFNYLETLDYYLQNTRYIGNIIAKNLRLAKYFFLRDQFKMEDNYLNETFNLNEIIDQCIDWNAMWRLLVIKKGFCCIRLNQDLHSRSRFIFLSGPNILSGSSVDSSDSIYEDVF